MLVRLTIVGLALFLCRVSVATDDLLSDSDSDFESDFEDLPTCWRECAEQVSSCSLDLDCYCDAAQEGFLATAVTCAREVCRHSWDSIAIDFLEELCSDIGEPIPAASLSAASSAATAPLTSSHATGTDGASKTDSKGTAAKTTTVTTHTTRSTESSSSSDSSAASATNDSSDTSVTSATSLIVAPSSQPAEGTTPAGVITSYVPFTATSSTKTSSAINPQDTNGSPFLEQPGGDGVHSYTIGRLMWSVVALVMVAGLGVML